MKIQNGLACLEEEAKPPSESSLFLKRPFFVAEKALFAFYPDYFKRVLSSNLQEFYSTNGHLSLLKSLQIEVVSQIDSAYQLWQEFSPNQTLFDTWEFRLAFWKGYQYRPYFLLLKNESENFGLLPLWYEEEKKEYFWFGSWWQEENSFFVKDPVFIPPLLAVSPTPTLLNAIRVNAVRWAKEFIEFKPDEPKYILDLRKIHSVEDFLARFKKKKRYNLRRDKRLIETQKPQIIFDHFADFDHLVALSKKRLHEKGREADWHDPRRVETFRQVIRLGQSKNSFKVRMITVRIGEKIAGVDLIALFGQDYYSLKCGYDVQNFPGIGNFVNLVEIEDALGLGMKKIDFLEIGYGWKQRWFEEISLFQYEKK